MENTTKALLIAAAVLIVIIIISLSMLLLNSSSDTTKQAQSVGDQMSMLGYQSLKEIKGSKHVFTQDFKEEMNNQVINNILNTKVRNKIYVTGVFYKKYDVYSDGSWGIYKNTCLKKIEGESDIERNKRIISQIFQSNDFIVVNDLYNIKDQMAKYLEKHDSIPQGAKGPFSSVSIYTNYDNEGYIIELLLVGHSGYRI